MSTDPPPIPPELRVGAPLPEPTTVWTPRAESARLARPGGRHGSMEALSRISSISLNFVYSVAGLALLGWLVDYFAKSVPIGLLIGAGLGVAVGAYRFVREATALNKKQASDLRITPKPTDPPA